MENYSAEVKTKREISVSVEDENGNTGIVYTFEVTDRGTIRVDYDDIQPGILKVAAEALIQHIEETSTSKVFSEVNRLEIEKRKLMEENHILRMQREAFEIENIGLKDSESKKAHKLNLFENSYIYSIAFLKTVPESVAKTLIQNYAVISGKKVMAIKLYREIFGGTLLECKKVIDSWF